MPLANLLAKRKADCVVQRRALEMWLAILTPFRWFTVIGTTVLSAVAGATILERAKFLANFSLIAGVCALGASILSALHTALHCDAHQAECRRLVSEFRSLEASFEEMLELPAEESGMRLPEQERRYEKAVGAAATLAPIAFRRRAEREMTAA